MSDIRIFVTHTPNRHTMSVDNPLFYNVIAGSDYQTESVPEGFYCDNTGENISSRNKSYCELTTQYWAWKNVEADYYGFCHYRRFFNFSEDSITESCWGTIEFDYLNAKAKQKLHLNEQDMRKCIEAHDFLIAKGVDASYMNAKSIYDQYERAPELHIEDVELLLSILKKSYPHLYDTAVRFFHGKTFYPCNMFIMKKELFKEYCAILFDVLEQFEKRADMRNYSREGYRTTGHLGERMAGIYYLYLKEQKKYKLGELQIALIHHADAEKKVLIDPSPEAVPIVLAANQKYVPILYTCAQSICENTSEKYKYHIYIFHTDITAESQKKFQKLSKDNIDFSFIDVGSKVDGYKLQAKEHITTETFYRFLILDILKGYKKVVYLDCDMIICHDVAELYHTELGTNLIAGVRDADFAGQCNGKASEMRQYCLKTLGLENPFQYFQAGTLVFNVEEMNKVTSVQKLFEMSDTGVYRFSDQDILNVVCKGRVTYLDMSWNLLFDWNNFRWSQVIKHAPYYILDEYEEARKHPYIVHYAGCTKPWMKPDEDMAEYFWEVARRNEFYEVLLSGMVEYKMSGFKPSAASTIQGITIPTAGEGKGLLEFVRRIVRHFFPQNSKARAWAISVYFKLKGVK